MGKYISAFALCNRLKYEEIDNRVKQTYAKGSKATLLRKLNDPYVKAIRWATDRIGNEGIIIFVTNNSFIDSISFDGMRRCLAQDFDQVFILDLGGNVRKNPKLSGTTHNVFGIQVGVSINLFIKKNTNPSKKAKIHYTKIDELWRKEQKYEFLNQQNNVDNLNWTDIDPDKDNTWLTEGLQADFEALIPLAIRKFNPSNESQAVFKIFSTGVNTVKNRQH